MAHIRRGLVAAAVFGVLIGAPRVAKADIAAAEALFREGRALMAKGKLAEACHKFSESERLDPSPGTLINLARCHAEQGRSASAWAEYLAAKRAAETAGRTELVEEARRQATALEPSLSTLTITAREPVPGLVVHRNGELLEATALGSKLPVDPGRYTITASAPGYEDYTTEVSVEAGAAAAAVTIPPLEPKPKASPSPPEAPAASAEQAPPAPAVAHRSGPPLAGYVVGGAGLVATGVGFAFGALAAGKYSSAKDACPTHAGCSAQAMSDRRSAETEANVANVMIGVGLAAVAVGVVLVVTHGSKHAERAALVLGPVVEPGGGGAFVRGEL